MVKLSAGRHLYKVFEHGFQCQHIVIVRFSVGVCLFFVFCFLRKTYGTYWNDIWWQGVTWTKEEPLKFSGGYEPGGGSTNSV